MLASCKKVSKQDKDDVLKAANSLYSFQTACTYMYNKEPCAVRYSYSPTNCNLLSKEVIRDCVYRIVASLECSKIA